MYEVVTAALIKNPAGMGLRNNSLPLMDLFWIAASCKL